MAHRYDPHRQVRVRFDFNADPPRAEFCGTFHGLRLLTIGFLLALLLIFLALPALPQTKFIATSAGGGGSGVTSVAATVPSFMAVSGSPITSTGTLAFTFNTQAQGLVFASPCSGTGAVVFRALCAADIPNIATSQVTGLDAALAGKQATGNYVTAGTGDVVFTGPGSVTATIQANSVALGTDTTGGYAGSASEGGAATTADALSANGTNCSAPNFGRGIDASGNCEGAAIVDADIPDTITINTAAAANALNSATTTVNVSSATAPTSGQVLTATSGSAATWQTPSAGGITGSVGTIDNALPRADGTGTTTVQGSDITVSDVASSTVTVATTAGNALAVNATAPAATSASQAGKGIVITGSNAVDGTSTHGGVAGGEIALAPGACVNNAACAGQVKITSAGTSTWPALCLAASVGSQCQSGFWYDSQGPSVAHGGSTVASFGASRISMNNGVQLKFASTANALPWAVGGTSLGGCGSECLALGNSDDSTGVDQRLQARTVPGTNIAARDLTLSPGAGTGNGAPGDFIVQTSSPGASGTTVQSWGDRLYIRGMPKTLTDGVATALFTGLDIASGTIAGGTLRYTIRAVDGSTQQSLRGQVDFSAVNEGGTETCTLGTPVENETSPTGTITNAVTCTTAGTNQIAFNLNADSSFASPTITATWSIQLDGGTGSINP